MNDHIPTIWIEIIQRWATDVAEIESIWLFGSRVKETNTANSDLDVAIQPIGETPEDAWRRWIVKRSDWSKPVLPVPVDLQYYHPLDLELTRMRSALREASMLIY